VHFVKNHLLPGRGGEGGELKAERVVEEGVSDVGTMMNQEAGAGIVPPENFPIRGVDHILVLRVLRNIPKNPKEIPLKVRLRMLGKLKLGMLLIPIIEGSGQEDLGGIRGPGLEQNETSRESLGAHKGLARRLKDPISLLLAGGEAVADLAGGHVAAGRGIGIAGTLADLADEGGDGVFLVAFGAGPFLLWTLEGLVGLHGLLRLGLVADLAHFCVEGVVEGADGASPAGLALGGRVGRGGRGGRGGDGGGGGEDRGF